MSDEPYLNTNHAADVLGVEPGTMVAYRTKSRSTGEQHGPVFYQPSHAIVRYKRSDLVAWLEGRPKQSPERELFSLNQRSTSLGRMRDETGVPTLTQDDADAFRSEARRDG